MTDQITVPRATWDAMREALNKLLKRDQRNTCQHEETHRGGVIWEICEGCGMKWADDRGGKPKWRNPPEWDAAELALTAANAVSHPQATEPAWRPIETAPKDGTLYLALGDADMWVENEPEGHFAGNWSWSESRGQWRGNAHADDRFATHWMPLPAAPEAP